MARYDTRYGQLMSWGSRRPSHHLRCPPPKSCPDSSRNLCPEVYPTSREFIKCEPNPWYFKESGILWPKHGTIPSLQLICIVQAWSLFTTNTWWNTCFPILSPRHHSRKRTCSIEQIHHSSGHLVWISFTAVMNFLITQTIINCICSQILLKGENLNKLVQELGQFQVYSSSLVSDSFRKWGIFSLNAKLKIKLKHGKKNATQRKTGRIWQLSNWKMLDITTQNHPRNVPTFCLSHIANRLILRTWRATCGRW